MYPGAGENTLRRLALFSYQDHPPKYDVTTGLNWAEQLVSLGEKMAFRLEKIFLYIQTIKFVSFHTEGREMLQEHFFDFLSKTFGKRENFSNVLKENNGQPSVIEWRILRICKSGVVPTFGSYRS